MNQLMMAALMKLCPGGAFAVPLDATTVDQVIFFDGETKPTQAELEAAMVPTLDELKTAKLAAFNAQCASLLAGIKAGYPDDEVQSWSKQETEARAFIADGAAATPLLSAMATARGLQVIDLAGRVIVKADAFAMASGEIIGTRQRCEDEITAAETPDAIAAVAW